MSLNKLHKSNVIFWLIWTVLIAGVCHRAGQEPEILTLKKLNRDSFHLKSYSNLLSKYVINKIIDN